MKKKIFQCALFLAAAVIFLGCPQNKKDASVSANAKTPGEDSVLEVKSITIFGKTVKTDDWSVEIPEDNSVLVAGNIEAEFNIAGVKVAIDGDIVRFEKGETKKVTLKVNAVPGKHKAWSQVISVKRGGEPVLSLKSLKIHNVEVDTTEWKVEIPLNKSTVSIENIEAEFNISDVNLTLAEGTVSFAEGETKNITLQAAGVPGKYKSWTQVVSVKREKSSTITIIDIKGIYVDGKLITNLSNTEILNQDNAVIKITVPNGMKYESCMIDGEEAAYTPASTADSFASYSKAVSGLAENVEKSIIIKVEDSRCSNSPVTKTVKVKYEKSSAYSLVPIQFLFIDEKDIAENAIEGAEVVLNSGTPLTLEVMLTKNPPQPYKESIKITCGSLSETKQLTARKTGFDFSSITSGTNNVKLERLIDNEVVKTYNFKVMYEQPKFNIKVRGIIINNVEYKEKPGMFGAKALYALKNEDYTEVFKLAEADENINVTVEIDTPDVKAVMTNNNGPEVTLSNGSASSVPVSGKLNKVKILLTKDGYTPLVYTFTAKKDMIEIVSLSVDGQSYTWEEFKAVAEIHAAANTVPVSVSWSNDDTFEEISLKKKGETANLFTVVNKTATANVTLNSAETELTMKLYIADMPWRKHTFKILKPNSTSPESNAEQLSVEDEWFIHNIISLGKKLDRPKYAEDADTIDLRVEPVVDDITGVELIEPVKQSFTKVPAAVPGDPVCYKTTITGFMTGKKITYKIIAKDGTEKLFGLNNSKPITLQSYIYQQRIRYDYEAEIDSKSPFIDVKGKGPYEYDLTLEQGHSDVYFKFSVLDGCENITFTGSRFSILSQKTVGNAYKYTEYLVKVDVSDLTAAGGSFDLEIPIVYKNPVSLKSTDIRTYTVTVNVPKA